MLSDDSVPASSRRNPVVVALASLIFPPLGHIYVGEVRRGVYVWIASRAIVMAAAIFLLLNPSLLGVSVMALAGPSAAVVPAIDAMICARRSTGSYRLRSYNRWYIYAGALVLIVMADTAIMSAIRTRLQAFRIPSSGMSPALEVGDFFFIDKAPRGRETPSRGDIVAFPFPQAPDKMFVKRIVGLPGEVIEIKDKQVFLDGIALEEPYALHEDAEIRPSGLDVRDNFGPFRIPRGQLFLMGDNRDNSNDSRYWGTLPVRDVLGRAHVIYWSWDAERFQARWRRIGVRLF